MCRRQRELGHAVEVHALVHGGAVAEMLTKEGFVVVDHSASGRWQAMSRLHDALKTRRPDVVHCHNWLATVAGAPAARWAGVPVIISTRHGLVPPPHPWKRELQFAAAAHFCQAIVGVCQATTRNLALVPGLPVAKLRTVYNGSVPAPAPKVARPLDPMGFPLLWVGRLSPPKDPQSVLRALALARQRLPALRLWIVGDGPFRNEAEQLAAQLNLADSVTFFGEQQGLADFYAAAAAFVLASRSEGLPIALLEAMAAGKPCLVTATGAMPELVAPPGLPACGLVSPQADVEALAAAMLEMAAEPARAAAWGDQARSRYLIDFTLERMSDRYLNLYQGKE